MKYKTLVFWFTGLSGSGKTTIAERVSGELLRRKKKVKVYDGDMVRKKINRHLRFTPADIEENNGIIASLCVKGMGRYDYIFVPIISPFSRSRALAKRMIGDAFHLVYVKVSLREAIKRDPKDLYKKALSGEIKNFIGIDKKVPYQAPRNASIVLDTKSEDVDTSVKRLLKYIDSAGRR